MAKNADRRPLTVIDPAATGTSPPRPLGQHGLTLWNAIMTEYDIQDRGGRELLQQVCEASDRLAALAERISADGEVIHTRTGPKSHPALRDELNGRAFICRTLERLGLNLEAVKPLGRPSRPGWRSDADE
jgi:hypothetical protein